MPNQAAITPPPLPDPPAAPITSVPLQGFAEKFQRGVQTGRAISGNPAGPLNQAVEDHYQSRLHEAQMHQKHWAEYSSILLHGIDPDTQQQLTPEAEAKYTNWKEAAAAAFAKAAGVSPETKQHIQGAKGKLDWLIGLAKQKREGDAGGAAGAGGATGAPPAGGMAPPPATDATAAGGASASAASGAPAAMTPPPAIPPYSMAAADAPRVQGLLEDQRKAAAAGSTESAKNKADLEATQAAFVQRQKQAESLKSLTPQEREEFTATGKFPASNKPTAMSRGNTGAELAQLGIALVDGSALDPKKNYDVFQNSDGTQFAMPSGLSVTASAARMAGSSGSSLMAVVNRANSGDTDAKKDLKTYIDMQKDLATSRGAGYGAGRAMYQIGSYVDGDTGQVIPLSAYDAIQRIRAGANLTPSGKLPASMIASAQRLVKEATPAIKAVRENLGAYDDAGDRAIFARAMTAAGKPAYGDESGWLGNVLNQVATDKLSPEGKRLVVRLARLNETIGTLRQALGAPATDRSMALMLGLLPGPSTPDSKMAGDMIDQLEQNVTNAVEIPVLKGVAKPSGKITPPPSTNAIDDEIMKLVRP